jgi:hypothetical protein
MRKILAFLNNAITAAEYYGDKRLADRLHNWFVKISAELPDENPEDTSGYRIDEHVGGKYSDPNFLSLSDMGNLSAGDADEEGYYIVTKIPPQDSEIYPAFDLEADNNALHLGSKIDLDSLLEQYDLFKKLMPYIQPTNGKVYAYDGHRKDWRNIPLNQVSFAQDSNGQWVPVFYREDEAVINQEQEPMVNAFGNPESAKEDAIRRAGGYDIFYNSIKLAMDELVGVRDIDIILAIAMEKIGKSYTDEENAVTDILLDLSKSSNLPWPTSAFTNSNLILEKLQDSFKLYRQAKDAGEL